MTTTTNVSVFVALATCTMLAACTLHGVDDGNLSPDAPASSADASAPKLPPPVSTDAGSGTSSDGGAVTPIPTTTIPADAPPRFTDLALWLDPNQLVTRVSGTSNAVMSWHDRTGNAAVTAGGATTNNATFTGNAAIVPSTGAAITAALKNNLGTRPFTVFVVARTSSGSSDGWLFGTNDTDSNGARSSLGIQIVGESAQLAWSSIASTGNASAGTHLLLPAIYMIHRHGMGVDVLVDDVMYLDSTSPAVYDAAGVNGAPEQIFFGGMTSGTMALGDILVYDADLSVLDEDSVRGYLQNKYGL